MRVRDRYTGLLLKVNNQNYYMTQLNNAAMKTVVETFIIEETQELIYDNEKLDTWNKHVESLGLVGQTKIQAPAKSPIPFLHMKSSLVKVFTTLCPVKVKVQDYDKTPIPVEILDLVALSTKENYFKKIEIWYDDKSPDPVCVGFTGSFKVYNRSWSKIATCATEAEAITYKSNPEYYNHHFEVAGIYLIGRWADVKASLAQLTEKAKALFMAIQKDEYTKRIKEAQRNIEDLEQDANRQFGYDNTVSDDLPF